MRAYIAFAMLRCEKCCRDAVKGARSEDVEIAHHYECVDALYADCSRLLQEELIRYRDGVVDGFENAQEASIDRLDGRNFGDVLVKIERMAISGRFNVLVWTLMP